MQITSDSDDSTSLYLFDCSGEIHGRKFEVQMDSQKKVSKI